METFRPGDRVVAINTDMSGPIRPPACPDRHPFQFPDGPLRKNVVYHVESVCATSRSHPDLFLSGCRVRWGNHEIPWHPSRFRKVLSLRDHLPKKRRRKQPASAPTLVSTIP
jgi:hypothetical protein